MSAAPPLTDGAPPPPPPLPAPGPTPAEAEDARRVAARMLTYRLMPVWVFLLMFGITLVWESAIRGNAITSEKLQAAALLALVVGLFIGAPLGIRFFNPLPPKT